MTTCLYFDVGAVDGCGCGFWRAYMTVKESYSGAQRLLGSLYHVQSVAGIPVGERGCDCLQLRHPFRENHDWETRWDGGRALQGVFE